MGLIWVEYHPQTPRVGGFLVSYWPDWGSQQQHRLTLDQFLELPRGLSGPVRPILPLFWSPYRLTRPLAILLHHRVLERGPGGPRSPGSTSAWDLRSAPGATTGVQGGAPRSSLCRNGPACPF